MGGIDKAEKRPSRMAILVSGFVFPGVGQFVQKRWLAGVLFGGVFSVLFCLLLVQCYRTIAAFYRIGLAGTVPDEELPPMAWILGLFGACLVVYVANIGDAYLGHRRAARRSAMKRHIDPLLASVLNEAEQDKGE